MVNVFYFVATGAGAPLPEAPPPKPGVSTSIASARTVEQLREIIDFATLSSDEISELSDLTN